MIDYLKNLDLQLFSILNGKFHHPVIDKIMVTLTSTGFWRIPLIIIVVAVLIFGRKKDRIAIGFGIILLVFTNFISTGVMKPLVGRIRPCHVMEGIRLLVPCGGKYSFPSGHAANSIALAIFLSYFYRKAIIPFLIIAILVSYSRIYVGVHYPMDVLIGAFTGIIFSLSFIFIYKELLTKSEKKWFKWLKI